MAAESWWALRARLGDLRLRWSGLPRSGRLNVLLYAFTVVSMLALAVEFVGGASIGNTDVSTATPTTVDGAISRTGITLRDRRRGLTVVPTSRPATATVTVAVATTFPPPSTPVRPVVTRVPVRRPPATTVAPPPETTPPPVTEPAATSSTKRPRTTIDPNDPGTPTPPVIPTFAPINP